jgi:hypothetical protein
MGGVRAIVVSVLILGATVLPSAQQVYSSKDSGVTPPTLVERIKPYYTQ